MKILIQFLEETDKIDNSEHRHSHWSDKANINKQKVDIKDMVTGHWSNKTRSYMTDLIRSMAIKNTDIKDLGKKRKIRIS